MNVMRRDVPSFDVLKNVWPTFKENLGVTLGAPAVLCFVPFLLVAVPASVVAFVVAGGAAMLNKGAVMFALFPVIVVAAALFAIVYNAIRVGFTRMLLNLAEGQPTVFSDITKGKPWFVNFLICNFIIGVATAIGGFLLIVPGVYVAVRCSMAPFLIVDKNMGPIEAIKESHEMVTGYGWQILIYYLCYAGANMLAGFVPIIGAVLPVAVLGFFDVGLAMIYVMRRQEAYITTSNPM
jgi:hypothetical protein